MRKSRPAQFDKTKTQIPVTATRLRTQSIDQDEEEQPPAEPWKKHSTPLPPLPLPKIPFRHNNNSSNNSKGKLKKKFRNLLARRKRKNWNLPIKGSNWTGTSFITSNSPFPSPAPSPVPSPLRNAKPNFVQLHRPKVEQQRQNHYQSNNGSSNVNGHGDHNHKNEDKVDEDKDEDQHSPLLNDSLSDTITGRNYTHLQKPNGAGVGAGLSAGVRVGVGVGAKSSKRATYPKAYSHHEENDDKDNDDELDLTQEYLQAQSLSFEEAQHLYLPHKYKDQYTNNTNININRNSGRKSHGWNGRDNISSVDILDPPSTIKTHSTLDNIAKHSYDEEENSKENDNDNCSNNNSDDDISFDTTSDISYADEEQSQNESQNQDQYMLARRSSSIDKQNQPQHPHPDLELCFSSTSTTASTNVYADGNANANANANDKADIPSRVELHRPASPDSLVQSQAQPSTMRSTFMKCLRCITHNPLSKCILRTPTVATSLPSIPTILLEHPKTTFGALVAGCALLDMLIIAPAYLLALGISELGVYLLILMSIWSIGRVVLRLIAFPGSTARIRGEIENEFTRYSLRMVENAAEAIMDLSMMLIQSENGVDMDMYVSSKVSKTLGMGRNIYDLIPLWKKVTQYRDRVLGMYHDVLHCLLMENGEGSFKKDHCDSTGVLTKYGNNHLIGDIGKLVDVSPSARENGEKLLKALGNVLDDLERLEACAGDYLNSDMNTLASKDVSQEGVRAAQRLLISSTELGECVVVIDPTTKTTVKTRDGAGSGEDDDASQESMAEDRHKNPIAEGFDNLKSFASTVLAFFDPPPLKSIFGLDVLRGSLLSRYRGAQQLWIPRPKSDGGGYVDAIHIPSNGIRRNLLNGERMEKAVLFCNPNAGLLEVATGLSLISGNVASMNGSGKESWTDFYLENGFDVILYNYSGFGRSHAGKRKTKGDFSGGIHILKRIIASSLFGFKPSPSSLKADATAAATHIIEKIRVENFLIHGESIGGMAASGAARNISHRKYLDANSLPVTYPTVLLCDRTFCNLNATAYHLVGSWTRFVIPLLTPFWNTNVAGDFTSARCRKVVAQDASDAIIHDAASLKTGISTAREFRKGDTKGAGAHDEMPLTYRMADYEEVAVRESKLAKFPATMKVQSPMWPADKHIEMSEAFHFAACVRRIGKVATNVRKNKLASMKDFPHEDEEEGIEITPVFSRDTDEGDKEEEAILGIWDKIGRCDGLAGLPLGASVKFGYGCTIDWLACITTLGCQRIALAAESRLLGSSGSRKPIPFDEISICHEDFNPTFSCCDADEDYVPLPLPSVIESIQQALARFKGFEDDRDPIKEVLYELEYSLKMLQYVMDRITSTQTVKTALQIAHFQEVFDGFSLGRFLNLNCGHNSQFSFTERLELTNILSEAFSRKDENALV